MLRHLVPTVLIGLMFATACESGTPITTTDGGVDADVILDAQTPIDTGVGGDDSTVFPDDTAIMDLESTDLSDDGNAEGTDTVTDAVADAFDDDGIDIRTPDANIDTTDDSGDAYDTVEDAVDDTVEDAAQDIPPDTGADIVENDVFGDEGADESDVGPETTPECTLDEDCDDDNLCTDDACVDGTCDYANNIGSCDDGDECTTGDTCGDGACKPGEWSCGDPCSRNNLPTGVTHDYDNKPFVIDCGTRTLEVTVMANDILRIKYPMAEYPNTLDYAVVVEGVEPASLTYGGGGDVFGICTGFMNLTVNLDTCRIAVTDSDGNTLVDDGTTGGFTEVNINDNGVIVRERRLTRVTPAGEAFYGFGEKTGPLNKRGMSMSFWNSDTPAYASDADPLYKSIPFFIGLRNGVAYGVLTDNTWPMTFDMARTNAARYVLKTQKGEFDQYIIAGPAISQVVDRYTRLTGRPFMPPRWTLGYHQCRWSYHDDTKVREIMDGFRSRRLPADGIWLDIDYMDGYRSWTWNTDAFPNPAGLVAYAEDIGFKVSAIIDPGLKEDPAWDIYQEGVSGDHFLKNPDGSVFVGEVWPGAAVFPDFTRPETRKWWGDQIPALSNVGVRGIWLDMNEPANFRADQGNTVPPEVTAYGDGKPTSMEGVHNAYALKECEATYDGWHRLIPNTRSFLLTRAAYAGIQRVSSVWIGDSASTWPALDVSLPMLLGLGLSGVPFAGSDIGGWAGGEDGQLFARWFELGMISPFARGHVQTGAPYEEPWMFGQEVEDISRIHLEDRYRLLPYMYSLFNTAWQTGAPILRPLVYEFQDDSGSRNVSEQAMLGPWLMYAPVLDENTAQRDIYLPPGRWIEWHSGALYAGPTTISTNVTLQALPVFMREGGIVVRGPVMQYSDEAPLAPLTIDVFPSDTVTTFDHHEDDGESMAFEVGDSYDVTYSLVKTATGAALSGNAVETSWTPVARRVIVRLRPVDGDVGSVALNGTGLVQLSKRDDIESAVSGWWADPNDRSIWVTFADTPDFNLEFFYDDQLSNYNNDTVMVPLRVIVPEGTPTDTPITVATDADGWTIHRPLAWSATEQNVAEGSVPVPRGKWFYFKYTRGGWSTVEKWGGCMEAENRYKFGKATPILTDGVTTWADWCL